MILGLELRKVKSVIGFTLMVLLIASLSSCGNGDCKPDNNSSANLLLKLVAPYEYPSGVAVTAYLTIYNTSSVNANNLYYDIPAGYNFTGAAITVKNGQSDQPCYNIPAYQHCTFPVEIGANSHPGSFTVNATPNGGSMLNKLEKSVKSKLGLGSNTISLTANIGLTEVSPNTQAGADGISFLYNKVIAANSDGSTQVAITAVVGTNAGLFNTINLVDASGNLLDFTTPSQNSGTGKSPLSAGSVVTFMLTIPRGVTNLPFYAQTMSNGSVVSPLSTNYNSLNTVQASSGILTVQPTSFSFSTKDNYVEQVLTYTNIGSGIVTGLNFVAPTNPIEILSNDCGSSLASGAICTIKLKSNALAGSSGTGSFTANYTNMPAAVVSQYNYVGIDAEYGISLTADNEFNFVSTTVNSSSSTQVTLSNTGNVMESNFAFTFNPNYFAISAGTGANSCTISTNKVINNLASGDSCSFTLTYTNNQVGSSTSLMAVNFNYNGSHTISDTKTLTYTTTQAVASLNITGNGNFGTIIANNQESHIQLFTIRNVGQDTATNINLDALTAPFASTSTCGPNLAVNESCTVTIKFGPTSLANNYNTNFVMNYQSSTDTSAVVNSTTQAMTGTARSPLTANVQISSVTATNSSGGNGEDSDNAFMIESTSATSANITLTYINTSSNYAAQSFSVNTSVLPPNYTLVNNGCSNITLQPSSANSCQVVLRLSTTAVADYNINLTNSLLGSWSDERGEQVAQAIDWSTSDGQATTVYVSVFPSANVLAMLSNSSSGSPVITKTDINQNFYVVLKLSGGYNVSTNTYTVVPPQGFTLVNGGTCAVSTTNSTCYVEITASSIVGTYSIGITGGNITPNPSSLPLELVSSINPYSYITNIGPSNPPALNGSGYILKCTTDQTTGIIDNCTTALSGLNSPEGMVRHGDHLYFASVIVQNSVAMDVVQNCQIKSDGDLDNCVVELSTPDSGGFDFNQMAINNNQVYLGVSGGQNVYNGVSVANIQNDGSLTTFNKVTSSAVYSISIAHDYMYATNQGHELYQFALNDFNTQYTAPIGNQSIPITVYDDYVYTSGGNGQIWRCDLNPASNYNVQNCNYANASTTGVALGMTTIGKYLYTISLSNVITKCTISTIDGSLSDCANLPISNLQIPVTIVN
ncbi:MAG: hypothetical protein PHC75_07675 [Burkholderiales bacterium]|nr:hypothetical protein [Burkholderiales bacterium]